MGTDDGDDWEQDILAHITPSAGNKRKRFVDESDGEIDSTEEVDDEYQEIKSWNKHDLMGNDKDRRRLMKMSELEREMVLAERRKKVDAYEEKMLLKEKVKSRELEKLNANLTDRQKKEQSLELLRKRREKKKQGISRVDNRKKKYRSSSEDDYESDYRSEDEVVEKNENVSFEDALQIQVRRDDIEKWIGRPMFEKAMKGCLVKVSVGQSSDTRETVYRCCEITDIQEYKRPYKVNNLLTKLAMELSHGKARKQHLFDMVSNQPFTEKEWRRLELTCDVEKIGPALTKKHLNRKLKDLEAIRGHVFTEAELSEIIRKKKEMTNVGNSYLEVVRLGNELQAAENDGDFEKVDELKKKLESLEAIIAPSKTASVDLIAQLNARNKMRDFHELRESHRQIIARRRKMDKTVQQNDPFARRKTAPVHHIATDKKLEDDDPESSGTVEMSKQASSLPSKQSSGVVDSSDDDDPLDSIDVSVLENDLKMSGAL